MFWRDMLDALGRADVAAYYPNAVASQSIQANCTGSLSIW